MTDREFERLAKKYPPIGSLVRKHPVVSFGVVMLIAGTHYGIFMGRQVALDKGTEYRSFTTGAIETI
jgi:hypothetical protein